MNTELNETMQESADRSHSPCLEKPVRCYFSCKAQNKRLTSTWDGKVLSSDKWSNKEAFNILPQGAQLIMIQSTRHERYIRFSDGTFSTVKDKEEASLWLLTKSNEDSSLFDLQCMDGLSYLCCQEGNIVSSEKPSTSWTIVLLSGELCFLSAAAVNRRLRCDLIGKLALAENWKGWEVWRFIEAGEGHVWISAWMHQNNYLCCNPQGEVFTCTNPHQDEGSKWAIQSDTTNGGDGVVIQSVAYDKLLCFSEEGVFMDVECSRYSVWQLEAAHRQNYSLSTLDSEKSIGPFPFVTDNKRQTDEWEVEQREDRVTFFSKEKQKFLGSTEDGSVHLVDGQDDRKVWIVELHPNGGRSFRSQVFGKLLSWRDAGEKNGSLCTMEQDDDDRAYWNLEPWMPRAVSGGKIKTFAMGTAFAVATTVAMPFAVAGVVGLIGAEVGILADIVAVGLTGAEAIASIGVVGTTAALVFRESGDSFASNNKAIEEDKKMTAISKRPFCSWRSW